MQCDMIRQDQVRYNTIPEDTMRCDTIRYDTIRYDTILQDKTLSEAEEKRDWVIITRYKLMMCVSPYACHPYPKCVFLHLCRSLLLRWLSTQPICVSRSPRRWKREDVDPLKGQSGLRGPRSRVGHFILEGVPMKLPDSYLEHARTQTRTHSDEQDSL